MTDLHIPASPVSPAPSGRGRGADSSLTLDDSVFNRLLKERIIFLGSEVNDQVANRICAQMLLLAAEDEERDIWLYINSPGGSVYSGMAIYDIMQFVTNDVATVAMGMAASMGQLLLCAGAPGKRMALPHARIMMHQPSGGIGGTASDIAIQAEQMLYTKRMFQERVAFHTGQGLEQIEADSDRDRWFTAEEARDYGFIDKVITGAQQAPEGAGTLA
ncbi:ATP-dependent Clp protease proteolytic subunit [Dactylosporangium aurantiacum]|jgi:ATP-dependent Clp protease, protease subunit|uniref:ATP-dependent Clp protease proteolytic subunit n=1 Tax=Dactylosporangium aurantiacum TaxID=35754 RepID=A0A9Q9MGH3_9ACTN|nr:ATP-dependent Clp protease proteolytic subunit [Dactylosporangium aurantiacum]MDG6108245.1 ATP-dependent Clp protease proteolytic subunit [Dactylosporangium aurantiacum]UWZ53770.1 ATP-dependent Clp protease proteolytic subunit [Dactylosporangium aurantiacum]